MDINNLTSDEIDNDYYSPELRIVFEDHMTYFRTHPKTGIMNIDPSLAYKYTFDLFGLLKYKNIPFQYHWVIMRINSFTSPTDNDDTLSTLLIPSYEELERIKNTFKTRKKA